MANDFLDKLKNGKSKIKKMRNNIVLKAAIIKSLSVVIPVVIVGLLIFMVFFKWQLEIIQGKTTANLIYEVLGIEDFGELIEIKGNEQEGYYWGFKDGVDEQLDLVIEELKKNTSALEIDNKNVLKKMILAEVATNYPDLGGRTFNNESTTTSVENLTVSKVVDEVEGKPYYWKGNGPDAFDCSGLVYWVYKQAGYNISDTSANGFAEIGREISKEELQPGDLICENWNDDKYNHIVIYIGDNQVISAESSCNISPEEHTSKEGCENSCSVIKREMTSEEKGEDDNKKVKYITLTDLEPKLTNETGTQKVDFGEVDNFQGTVHLRRITPNKNIGELKDISTAMTTETTTYVKADSEGLGTKQDIDDNIKKRMKKSMPEGTTEITYDDLSYLKIPYWGFDGKEYTGEMIVRKELADEMLLIFQELYKEKYPIYKMILIDDVPIVNPENDLDWNSIEDNNTSAFCYRNGTGSNTTSYHGYGQAIDINPLINPYVKNVGDQSSHSVSNNCKYISRELSTWTDNAPNWGLEIAKKANIDTNTKIYDIFIKYGWTWGGDWNSPKDYQHFEKRDLSKVAKIVTVDVDDEEEEQQTSNQKAKTKGLGEKSTIPDNIKELMIGKTAPEGTIITNKEYFEKFSYLKIPYYDSNGEVEQGYMIVNKELADEVLLIFKDLYDKKYQINSMKLIDNYAAQQFYNKPYTLEQLSIKDNNTAALWSSNNLSSVHTSGQAIDINPANEDMEDEVIEIFEKYGWTWEGDESSTTTYMHNVHSHFEKKDLTDVEHIEEDIDNTSNENIAGDGKNYVIAIDAGHGDPAGARQGLYSSGTADSTGLTKMEEWQSNRTVADAVADKLSIYSNLKIVRIGNSDANPIVRNGERINMGMAAEADVYVTIHYNSVKNASARGTIIYYPKENGQPEDKASIQLAEILARTVSSNIGIPINGKGIADEFHTGKDLSIIRHSNLCGFPNVCIEAGFMSNYDDMLKMQGAQGMDNYATGVAEGLLEYLGLENKGYGAAGSYVGGVSSNNAGIESKIYDLKYVPMETFEQHINEGNLEALKEFTIDVENSNKIIVATWSYNDGEITLRKKQTQSAEKYTENYNMPMEYLLAYYIDTRDDKFINDLANLALDSEFVLAIKDNVSTVLTEEYKYTTVTDKRQKTTTMGGVRGPMEVIGGPTKGAETLESSNLRETVTTEIELTYADTWCVKFYKDISYNSDSFAIDSPSNRVDTIQIINGNVSNRGTNYITDEDPNTNKVDEKYVDGEYYYFYKTTVKTTRKEINSITYRYNTGEEYVLGNEQKFITIYKKNKMFRISLKPEWLFNVLEQQEKTADMIDLTKYLLYSAAGEVYDFGITKFDFSIFTKNQFKDSNSRNVSVTYSNTF